MRSLPLGILSAALLVSASALAQQAGPAVRIVNPIDERQLVTIKGTMHPLANSRNDRGAAPDEMQLERMHLVLKRSNTQETALRQLIADLHTPGTANYHKWLTPDAFGKQFGPSDQDIAAVETWLAGHGFNVAQVNPGRQTIEFSGNVKQFRSAFHAQIHKYAVNGETHFANAADPQIPAALAPVVGGFVSLNNFRATSYAKYLGKAQYDPKTDRATADWTIGSSANGYYFLLAPGDFSVQYDLNPLYTAGTNGSGQTIAIINESNINVGLVNSFRSLFLPSYPANPPQIIIDGNDPGVDGINNPSGPNGASTEAYLDVEWAGAVAPDATVDLVIAADTALQSGLTLAMEHAVYANIAPVMSLSFGNCEANLSTFNGFLNSLWEQAAAQGITVMVSAGDAGSAGCDNDNTEEYAIYGQAVNGFASTPYNIAVGGTDFYYSDFSQGLSAMDTQMGTYWSTTASNTTPAVSIKGVIPEQPWNGSQYGLTIATLQAEANGGFSSTDIQGGGGGSSAVYTTKPAWQTGFGDAVRDLPDVSLFASDGFNASYYPICAGDGDCQAVTSGSVQISGVGGTSASSPAFAGIMALVNQKYGRQGQANFVLYPLSKQVPTAFNDVKNGSNTEPCDLTSSTPNCVAAPIPVTITGSSGSVLEGMIGTGTTPWYNAATGYDEASGLGTVDANVLVTNWGNVTFASTTTTLTPTSGTTFTHGTAFTFDGTVNPASGTATGDVALMTDSTEPLQQGQSFYTLSAGAYSGSINYLPGGAYNIWGQYGGDSKNAESSSTPVSITVNPEASGIYLTMVSPPTATYTAAAPPTNLAYGTQLDVTAQVAPSSATSCLNGSGTCVGFTVPTGTIAFADSGNALNTALINAEGNASYNAPFGVGSHSVTASYAGDNSYNASTASAIKFSVVKDTPTIQAFTSIQDSSNSDLVNGPGQPTVLTVALLNSPELLSNSPVPVAAPTGSVTLSSSLAGFSGSQTLSSAVDPSSRAVEGVATFNVPAGTVSGTYNVSVSYAGDGNYNSQSTSYSIPIETTSGDGALTSTISATLTGSISPTSSVTITGTVTGQSGKAAPTGSLYVYSSGNYPTAVSINPATSGDVSSFSITLNSQTLFQGSNQITLQYVGDSNYNPSALVLSNSISNPLSDFTLIPQTSIVPISVSGGASSGTSIINVASVNGFSGAVNLTCTAAAGVSCAILPSAPSLTSGSSTTATLTINATAGSPNLSYNVLITGADSTGKYVHTTAVEAVVTGSLVTASFGLSANPASLSITQGATTGNTSTITVSPVGSFAATVDLSCAVTTTIVGPAAPATCSMALPSVTGGSGTDVVTVTTSGTTSPGPYTVTVTGTSGSITQTATVNVTVNSAVAPSFSMTNAGNVTVTAGAITGNTTTVTLTSAGGYSGTVNLSCAISPTAASDPASCSLASSSVTVNSTTTPTVVVTIGTTAATTSRNEMKKLFWPSMGGAALALLLFFVVPRRRNWMAMLGLLVLFAAGAAVGCGGGGGGGGGGNPGTTPGTYTVTVTGKDTTANITQNTAFTLTVN
ncbi:MAG TPA: Ig-like domain repeat protein [Terracidiphilus sp.]|nr:Ig-like domain repeat protein [Terracidiphilus sp.]